MDLEQQLYKLNQIGIALSDERDVRSLLEKILTEARQFTRAEGASLYIIEQGRLCFVVSQNEKLASNKDFNANNIFVGKKLPLDPCSMAGYVGLTGEIVNVEDAYAIPPEKPYRFQRSFDATNNYRTRSMLVVPMKDSRQNVMGVLALINARSLEGNITSFDHRYEQLVLSLASQAAVAYNNACLHDEVKKAYLDTVFRLAMAAECREPDIAGHLQRMSEYSVILSQELGFSHTQVQNIRCASPMHDIGKLGIPDSILLKEGKLTEDEYQEMKRHTVYGAKILAGAEAEIIQLSEKIALSHHEHFDGSGYPKGLKGEEIPLEGRITALADVFDALASKRVYKSSWDLEQIVEYIVERSGKQFDPRVVKVFKNRLDDFIAVNNKYQKFSQ